MFGKKSGPVAYQTPTPTASVSKTPAKTATPTANPTAGWLIYTDTKHGFELKYPSTASVVDQSSGPAGTFNVEVHYDKNNNSYEPTRVIISNSPDTRSNLKFSNVSTFSSATTDSNGENYI